MRSGDPLDGIDVEQVVAEFDHFDPAQASIEQRHARYDAIRNVCPVTRSERHGGFWHVTGYPECQEALGLTDLFSNTTTSIPREQLGDFVELPPINLDPPRHGEMRKVVLPSFSPKVSLRWEPTVREYAHELIDSFIGRGGCDASSEYARRIPVRVMALLLGVPPEDEDRYISWIHAIMDVGANDVEAAVAAAQDMYAYLGAKIEERTADPKDDLLSLAITSEVEGRKLNHNELCNFGFLLVAAGIDTTWSVLGHALLHLATHDDDRRRLVEDPSLIPSAVEEFLRFYAPAPLGRLILQDTDVLGVPMKKDEMVMLSFPAANRDPRVFDDPDVFKVDRKPNRHMGFGLGIHRCLGSTIARLELKLSVEAWLERIPDFRLSDPDAVSWSTGHIWGPRALPLSW